MWNNEYSDYERERKQKRVTNKIRNSLLIIYTVVIAIYAINKML